MSPSPLQEQAFDQLAGRQPQQADEVILGGPPLSSSVTTLIDPVILGSQAGTPLEAVALNDRIRQTQAETLILRDPAQDAVNTNPLQSTIDLVASLEELVKAKQWLDSAAGDLTLELGAAWGRSIRNHPIDWTWAVICGFFHELWSMVTGAFDLILTAVAWEMRVTGCITGVIGRGLAELVLSDVTGPDVGIQSEKDPTKTVAQIQAFLRQLDAGVGLVLGAAKEASDHPIEFTTAVIEMATLAIHALTRALEVDGSLRGPMLEYMSDSKKSGRLTGAVAAQIILVVSTGGGGEAVEAAKVADALSITTRHAEELAKLRAVTPELADLPQAADLANLLGAIRAAFRKSRLRFSNRITLPKTKIIDKVLETAAVADEALVLERARVAVALLQQRGQVDTYRILKRVLEPFNERSKLIFMLDLRDYGPVADALSADLASRTLSEQLLDALHLVDARLLGNLPPQARTALGWATKDDMPAVVGTASEHRISLPAYFKKLPPWSSTDGANLSALPMDLNEVETITQVFRKRLVRVDAAGKPLPGEFPLTAGAVPIGPNTSATTIIQECLETWKLPQFNTPGGITSTAVLDEFERLLTRVKGM